MTEREQEVLRLVAEGYTNREIADMLGIGVETVKSHVKSILRSLQAHNRAHAVALWMRQS